MALLPTSAPDTNRRWVARSRPTPNGAPYQRSDHGAKDFVGRAIPIARGLDDPFTWMLVRGNVGLASLLDRRH